MLKETRIVTSSSQVSTDLGDEIAILNLDTGMYFGLSNVGAHIWRLIGEPRTVAQIHQNVLSQYEVASERSYEDLAEFLDHLADAGLVSLSDANSS